MRKNQTKIEVMECVCFTTDDKDGVRFALKAPAGEEAKRFLPTYNAILKIKEKAINRIDNNTHTIEWHIDTYNEFIIYLKKCSILNIDIDWDLSITIYVMIISSMFILQHYKIIPTDKWHYFQLNI